MILKKEEILKEIEARRVIIDPFDINAVKDASIELTFGSELGIFRGDINFPIDSRSPNFSVVHWIPFSKGPYKLEVNDRVVGKTREKITLSSEFCGWITPRARTAIFGLSLEVTTGFIQPNTTEQLFFLIINSGRFPILLYPNIKICQLVVVKI